MGRSISRAREVFKQFLDARRGHDSVGLYAQWRFQISRAQPDGTYVLEPERVAGPNQMTADGLNALASRGASDTTSPFGFIAVGTVTAAGSLGSNNIGEVIRKVASTRTSSNEVLILVATYAGDADSITSLDLRTAAGANHANSGQGDFLNTVNSVATILADSDFLRVQLEVQVGSHNL